MGKKITIRLGADETRLLDDILNSKYVQLETAEQAIVWSLGVANLFLEEYAKQGGPVILPWASKKVEKKGLTPELAPSPAKPYDVAGIDPDLAPHPALSPIKDPKDVILRELAHKIEINRDS